MWFITSILSAVQPQLFLIITITCHWGFVPQDNIIEYTLRKPATVAIHTYNPLWFFDLWTTSIHFSERDNTNIRPPQVFKNTIQFLDMASATVDRQPFRFLDLPKDIRLCVYNKIDLSTRHVLDRSQAVSDNYYWPAPPTDQVYGSRIILIKPDNGFAIDILATCHLIHQEASQILKRKFEHCRS